MKNVTEIRVVRKLRVQNLDRMQSTRPFADCVRSWLHRRLHRCAQALIFNSSHCNFCDHIRKLWARVRLTFFEVKLLYWVVNARKLGVPFVTSWTCSVISVAWQATGTVLSAVLRISWKHWLFLYHVYSILQSIFRGIFLHRLNSC